jgi:hypothetical protein
VNICRAFSFGQPSAALSDILYLFAVVIILAPLPFKLMRKRVIK